MRLKPMPKLLFINSYSLHAPHILMKWIIESYNFLQKAQPLYIRANKGKCCVGLKMKFLNKLSQAVEKLLLTFFSISKHPKV